MSSLRRYQITGLREAHIGVRQYLVEVLKKLFLWGIVPHPDTRGDCSSTEEVRVSRRIPAKRRKTIA